MLDANTISEDDYKFKKFIKKPIPVLAVQINEPFYVDTLECRMFGQAGDYLVIGVFERFPVSKEIFEETYEELNYE